MIPQYGWIPLRFIGIHAPVRYRRYWFYCSNCFLISNWLNMEGMQKKHVPNGDGKQYYVQYRKIYKIKKRSREGKKVLNKRRITLMRRNGIKRRIGCLFKVIEWVSIIIIKLNNTIPISQYGMKHMRSFANICNAGIKRD